MKRPIVLLLLCLLSAGPVSAQAATADSLEIERVVGLLGARLDTLLTRYQEYGFWGSVLVAQRGKVVLLKGYGLADLERKVSNSAATRFEMNSITKTFTAAAILKLAAEGRLAVTDPVERHLGSFRADKRSATIEDLATHTAGLVVGGATLATESLVAFVESVKRTPRESPPGQEYRYTNAGFSLLAAVIEKVTDDSYENYLRRNLFPAAVMRSAGFRDEVPVGDARFARGYVGTPAGLAPGPAKPHGWSTRG
ncbi:MAG TPA: serine hydrolase domain-containing protein, partial [Gemmatimonadales bacterium]